MGRLTSNSWTSVAVDDNNNALVSGYEYLINASGASIYAAVQSTTPTLSPTSNPGQAASIISPGENLILPYSGVPLWLYSNTNTIYSLTVNLKNSSGSSGGSSGPISTTQVTEPVALPAIGTPTGANQSTVNQAVNSNISTIQNALTGALISGVNTNATTSIPFASTSATTMPLSATIGTSPYVSLTTSGLITFSAAGDYVINVRIRAQPSASANATLICYMTQSTDGGTTWSRLDVAAQIGFTTTIVVAMNASFPLQNVVAGTRIQLYLISQTQNINLISQTTTAVTDNATPVAAPVSVSAVRVDIYKRS